MVGTLLPILFNVWAKEPSYRSKKSTLYVSNDSEGLWTEECKMQHLKLDFGPNDDINKLVQVIELFYAYSTNNFGYFDAEQNVYKNSNNVKQLFEDYGVDCKLSEHIDFDKFDMLIPYMPKDIEDAFRFIIRKSTISFPLDCYYIRFRYDKEADPVNCKLEIDCIVTDLGKRYEDAAYGFVGTFDDCLSIIEEFLEKVDK